MKSDAYWKRRAEQRMYEYIQEADRVADEVGKAYLQAAGYLEAQTKKIFDTYRKGGGLSEAEARRLLNDVGNATDYDALKKAYNRVKDPDLKQTLLNQLNAPAYRARIERLQQLREELDRKCRELYKIETKAADEHLINTAQNAYYRTMYDIQIGTGYGFGFAQISEQGVNEILRNNWSGASYSSRIWSNTQTVAELIKNELFLGVLAGKSQHEMSAAIMEKMGVGAMQARRLVRTESCYVANQAEMESYKECEIEKYRFVATLDMRTSEICASLDGKEFPVDKQQPNVNCPPMHPNCRSTTIAVFDAELMEGMQRRAVDPETGKDIFVPADMTYEEWYEKYVTNSLEGKAAKKKFENKEADKLQFRKYKIIYGKELEAKNLADFQRMKYNNPEKWALLKAEKQSRLNTKSFNEIEGLKGSLGNKEVRSWYKAHDKNIPNVIDREKPLADQAKQAFELRNTYRTQARDLMKDQEARKVLDKAYPNPSFESLIEHKKKKYGMTYEEACTDIIRSSTTTNRQFDATAGLKGDDNA